MSLVHRVERTWEQHKGLRRRQHHLAIGLDGDAIELARDKPIDGIHGRDNRFRVVFIRIEQALRRRRGNAAGARQNRTIARDTRSSSAARSRRPLANTHVQCVMPAELAKAT